MLIPPGSHDFVVNVTGDLFQFDNSSDYKTHSGLKVLLDASYPEATHDSSSHPTSCFPGTRLQYIEDITAWAQAPATERRYHVMWLRGPAGVGKSALAQSCAEELGVKLAAAFFFSRLNSRDISTRFFPSIAYQLTTKSPLYREKLNKKIIDDPSLVGKSLITQFRELIVDPILELQKEGQSVEEGVIFIDGLDECAGEEAQCTIIDTIFASVRDRTTPFTWAFFSRPEPRIVSQFEAPHVHDLFWQLILPVSHDADGDIELYLQDSFRKIRAQYGVPSTALWPSKGDIQELVRRSAGLFIYPASIIRFVGEGGILGPEEQLRSILRLPNKLSHNPWSHLDVFYALIMEQILEDMIANALKLLLYHTGLRRQSFGNHSVVAAAALGFSLSAYCAALSKLHSVVQLMWTDNGILENITFYHSSFADFLGDPHRSGRFCVKTPENYAALLGDMIRRIDDGFDNVILPWQGTVGMERSEAEWCVKFRVFGTFWELASYAKLDEDLLRHLSQCDFRNLAKDCGVKSAYVNGFFHNIPLPWRRSIMRPYRFPLWKRLFRRDDPAKTAFVLGNGNKSCEVVLNRNGKFICQDRGALAEQATSLEDDSANLSGISGRGQ